MRTKVVLLEDNDGIRDMLKFFLEDEGFLVMEYASIGSFMVAANNNLPDLFILDVMLGDGNGMDVCNKLKSDEKTAHIPVIMMSAHEDIHTMKRMCAADDFVSKPFDIFELILKIRDLLSDVHRSEN